MMLLKIISFYIVNFSFFIKADCSNINRINVSCTEPNYYYDSMVCACTLCNSGLINENNCYSSNNNMHSLYKNEAITYNDGTCSDGKLTELDDNGNWLGYLMCAKTSINYNSVSDSTFNPSFDFYYLSGRSYTYKSFDIYNRNNINIGYLYDSCINGFYEKSCQYLANLCVLSIYRNDNICKVIDDLSEKLNIKHLIQFNETTQSLITDKTIDVETSFDKNDYDNINLIALYIAK
jgi:hypothetical protein